MKLVQILAALSLSLIALPGCGGTSVGNDGTLVGGACESDADCDDSCKQDGDFPGGVCTQPCDVSDECPDGTVCIEKDSGLCLLECETDEDCREGWNCETVDEEGSEAKVAVCQKK